MAVGTAILLSTILILMVRYPDFRRVALTIGAAGIGLFIVAGVFIVLTH